ncbi:MFS transporter [Solicola gregarius]|uniref:MFS transporter n=1 Tax=Solicola gregarius TaxID=2908642 RepID=A0AA46YK86_9ACTN|nr:MFS transporter [Solicola gregarius]UYM04319.1 MFS transporter [Solicola gregarius]
MASSPASRERHGHRLLALVCLIALALNLRSVVSSVGVSLDAIIPALSMSGATAGLLTTLPVLSFALFGATANTIARTLGLHRTAAASLAALTIGMVVRAFVDSTVPFMLATTLALAGAATGNVILPPLVKRHFPDRVGTITAVYTSALLVGAALPPALTVPIADNAGGWRAGLLAWGILAAVCLLPWLGMLGHDVHPSTTLRKKVPFRAVARSPMAWAMAVFFGVQSSNAYVVLGWLAQAYTDAGLHRATAGVMIGLVQALGIPTALLLPQLSRRLPNQALLPVGFALLSAAGWIGVMAAAETVPWLWAVLLGLGGGAFPWVLSMIGLRTHTPAGTAALSGFVQSVGYLLAAIGPFGVGLLHDATDSWTAPLVAVAGASLLMLIGLAFARPRWFEDTLPPLR